MKRIILLLTVSLLAYSCSNDDDFSQNTNQDKLSEYDVVLQERSPTLPDKWDRSPKPRLKTKNGSNNFMPDDYLGYSYKVIGGNGIIGDQDNTGNKVINTELILAGRHKSIIKNQGIGEPFHNAFSYSDFESYYEKNKTAKKFSSGFELNLKVFKIGHTSKVTKTFIKERTKIKNAIYAEVDAGNKTGMHTISTTNAAISRIASDYLDPSFLEDLYYTPVSKLIENYGEFVLTGYFSGGRAHAEYIGGYDESLTLDSAEKNMDTTVGATYTWKPNSDSGGNTAKADASTGSGTGNLANGNYGWGRDYENIKKVNSKIKQVYFTFKAIGGAGITLGNVNPATVDDVNINLDAWISSLSTPTNQKLIEILDKGLTGINVFMLEQNFKQRFQDTHLDLCAGNEFFNPRIEIIRIPVRLSASRVQLYDIVPVLYTRHGDLLILDDGKAANASDAELLVNNDETTFNQKSKVIAAEKAKYYKGIGITSNFKKIVNPRFRYPLNFKLTGLNEGRMKKFYNENTEMWYMYDETSLIAYAFWFDDYILRHYGLLDWFKALPEAPLNMVSLSNNFKVFGL